MQRGVPQGSVLGPLLWNIGYDWALRGSRPRGVEIVCYADDTLVVASAQTFERTARLATTAVERVVRRIEALGLTVALNKTEALCFHGPRRAPPPDASLMIGGTRVGVSAHMKYLGLTLDGRWEFKEHFRRLTPKLVGAARALSSLLPNLGGPSATCRRLYTGVVRSMALYGAPVWVDALSAHNRSLLFRAQRILALRVIRGYRTVSHEAACILAGTPPWDLDAQVLAEVYGRRAIALEQNGGAASQELEGWRREAQQQLLRRWSDRLNEPNTGQWTVAAVRPILKEWVDRRHGTLTFRLVQILSGHGSFGRYLCFTAGREPLPRCHHCTSSEDTAEHTLTSCPEWRSQRVALMMEVGPDLSLPALVKAMVEREESWNAVVSFCESVMTQKETAERAREDDPASLPMRRKRTGQRRRQFAAASALAQ